MKPSVTTVWLLFSLLGCQPAMPNPSLSPIPSSSPTPSLSPSAEPALPVPTPPVTPTPYPESSPQPTPDPRIGVTHFTSQIACEDFSPEQLRRLDAPRDLVVSRDGQTLYITPETAFIKSWRSNGVFQTQPIARTPLYKLHNGRLEVINQSNNAAYSCGWNGEIERWQDDQVLFSYPDMETGVDTSYAPIQEYASYAPIQGYTFYSHNGAATEKQAQIQVETFDGSINQLFYQPPNLLRNLHVEQGQRLYYQLFTPTTPVSNRIERYDRFNRQATLLFKIDAAGESVGNVFVNETSPSAPLLNLTTFTPGSQLSKHDVSFLTAPVSCPGWSSEKSPILTSQPRFYRGSYYFSDAVNHMIWSHVPGSDIRCFAGGQRGFADGQGQAARFREPAELVFDDAGNLYVADKGNDAIRKITPAGEVSTLYQAPQE